MNTQEPTDTKPDLANATHKQAIEALQESVYPGVEMLMYGKAEEGSESSAREVVSTFGELALEYAAIRKAAGVMLANHRGVMEVKGKDRLSFLQAMITNLTWDKATKKGLEAGHGVYSFLLNGKGRIEADMNVLELGDKSIIETDARLMGLIKKTLEKYVFSEQVSFEMSDACVLGVHGPGAGEALREFGLELGDLVTLGKGRCAKAGELCGKAAVAWRDDACGVSGYGIAVKSGDLAEIWKTMVEKYADVTNKRLLRPVGWLAYNTGRIEAGRALFGIDFDNTVLPGETSRFEEAVSLTKGCYLGQEIVARMHARGQLARKTVGLRVSGEAQPISGSAVYEAGKAQIGVISSSTVSPVLSGVSVALAMVKKPYFEIGTKVLVPAEGAFVEATVVQTPFIG